MVNIMDTLYGAKKYLILQLCHACRVYVQENMHALEACGIYSQVRLVVYRDSELGQITKKEGLLGNYGQLVHPWVQDLNCQFLREIIAGARNNLEGLDVTG